MGRRVSFADEKVQELAEEMVQHQDITHDGAIAKNDVSQLGLMDETDNQAEEPSVNEKTPEEAGITPGAARAGDGMQNKIEETKD